MLEDGDALKLFHKIGYDVKLGKNRVANKGKVRLISKSSWDTVAEIRHFFVTCPGYSSTLFKVFSIKNTFIHFLMIKSEKLTLIP